MACSEAPRNLIYALLLAADSINVFRSGFEASSSAEAADAPASARARARPCRTSSLRRQPRKVAQVRPLEDDGVGEGRDTRLNVPSRGSTAAGPGRRASLMRAPPRGPSPTSQDTTSRRGLDAIERTRWDPQRRPRTPPTTSARTSRHHCAQRF